MEQAQVQQPWHGTGRLDQLVAELERQRGSAVDFIADSRELDVITVNDKLHLMPNTPQVGEWLMQATPIRDKALVQIGQRVDPDVPATFLKRLATQRPHLAADLLSKLLHLTAKRRLVRCMDGNIRAFLSDRFLCIDNYALAFTALDAVRASGGNVVSATLTEDNMRLKFTTNNVWETINTAKLSSHEFHDVSAALGANQNYKNSIGWTDDSMEGGSGMVVPTCTLSNSETGNGRLILELGVLNKFCVNTCLMDESVARVHLGESMQVGIFTPETVRLETQAIMAKIKDAIAAAFHPATFKIMVDRMRDAQSVAVQAPAGAVQQCIREHGLPDTYVDNLLAYFVKEEQTAYGMGQAVSRFAQDFDDPDKSYELEKVAGSCYKEPRLVPSK